MTSGQIDSMLKRVQEQKNGKVDRQSIWFKDSNKQPIKFDHTTMLISRSSTPEVDNMDIAEQIERGKTTVIRIGDMACKLGNKPTLT